MEGADAGVAAAVVDVAETNPVETKPVEANPVGTSPVGTTPVGTTPAPASAHAAHDGMHLDADVRKDVTRRLRNASGHLEGVLRMLDDPSVYCVDVLKQVKAVQGALSKVNEAVLRSHVRDHVVTAAQRGDAEVIVDELMEALKYRT